MDRRDLLLAEEDAARPATEICPDHLVDLIRLTDGWITGAGLLARLGATPAEPPSPVLVPLIEARVLALFRRAGSAAGTGCRRATWLACSVALPPSKVDTRLYMRPILSVGMDREYREQARLRATSDFAEGVAASFQRRPPNFTGTIPE
ncbi:hypothetical protein GCM10009736_09410 [Actinomadura bangladeshensis]